jgi:clan AA aspartic protease
MLRGQVSAFNEALVPLQLRGAGGETVDVEAAIDTGFTGALTLSSQLLAQLQLPFRMTRSYALGDGSEVEFDVHGVTVVWGGHDRDVEALVTSGGILIGMSLLSGHHLFIDVIDGGEVRVEARP